MSERRWKQFVALVAVGALVVRLVLIATTGGGFNLRIFHYFGGLILDDINPYAAPVGGEFGPRYGDNAPPELLLFAGLLKIHDSADTLRAFFTVADLAVITTVGLAYPRSRAFRANFIAFYAFNPLMLEAWTAFADDKAVILLLTIAVLIGLERDRLGFSWAAAAALGAFKWISVVFAPALAIHTARIRSKRWLVLALLAFAGVLFVSQVPYFPDSLEAFDRRSARIDIDPPIHASVTQLLDAVGLYDPLIPRIFMPVSLALVYGFFLLRRIDVKDTVVLSLFFAYVALPDEGFNRMLQITLPFLLVIAMPALRWTLLWLLSSLAALAVLVEFRDTHVSAVESAFGAYGSVRHVLFVNVVMVAVLFWFLRDRLKRPTSAPAELADDTASDWRD